MAPRGLFGSSAQEWMREAIPAHVRVFATTLMGDRSPITEKNFSRSELAALSGIVRRDQQQAPARARENVTNLKAFRQLASNEEADFDFLARNQKHLADYLAGKPTPIDDELFNRVGMGQYKTVGEALNDKLKGNAEWRGRERRGVGSLGRYMRGDGAVRYGENEFTGSYPDRLRRVDKVFAEDAPLKVGPIKAGLDFGDRNVNAIANTVGQFVYKTRPDGSVTIDDSYDWDATHGGERPSLADGLKTLFTTGSLEDLGASIAPDASRGRPIHIRLPPR